MESAACGVPGGAGGVARGSTGGEFVPPPAHHGAGLAVPARDGRGASAGLPAPAVQRHLRPVPAAARAGEEGRQAGAVRGAGPGRPGHVAARGGRSASPCSRGARDAASATRGDGSARGALGGGVQARGVSGGGGGGGSAEREGAAVGGMGTLLAPGAAADLRVRRMASSSPSCSRPRSRGWTAFLRRCCWASCTWSRCPAAQPRKVGEGVTNVPGGQLFSKDSRYLFFLNGLQPGEPGRRAARAARSPSPPPSR